MSSRGMHAICKMENQFCSFSLFELFAVHAFGDKYVIWFDAASITAFVD